MANRACGWVHACCCMCVGQFDACGVDAERCLIVAAGQQFSSFSYMNDVESKLPLPNKILTKGPEQVGTGTATQCVGYSGTISRRQWCGLGHCLRLRKIGGPRMEGCLWCGWRGTRGKAAHSPLLSTVQRPNNAED
jgi:hypothetical protein